MGLFLSMSGVVGGDEESVAAALRAYAEDHNGSMEIAESALADDECLVVSRGAAGVSVLYPSMFLGWDSAAEYLSNRLKKPVFSFHIHDGDLWMYLLYDRGDVVDQFNPVPDYWQELEDEERHFWRGNATEIARRVPGLAAEQIAHYLVPWGDEVFQSVERRKAYPADQFYYGDDWQLVDFMNKLGLAYPVDGRGIRHGVTYRFRCDSRGAG